MEMFCLNVNILVWHCVPVLQSVTVVGKSRGGRGSIYYFLQMPGNLQLPQNIKLKERERWYNLLRFEASGLGRALSCTIFSHFLKARYTSELPQEPDMKGCPQGHMETPNKRRQRETCLVVQKLGLHTSKAGDPGSNPGQVTRSHMPN